MTKILVVDDEETLCEAMRFNLEEAGYEVDTACGSEEALSLDLTAYSLILLDIMMGDISGTQLASILKNNPKTSSIPVIFCTARDDDDDMVAGLELGADDYITKPFSVKNLLARVKSVLRRTGATPPAATDTLSHEGLKIYLSGKRCEIDGTEVRLARKEFEILCKLMGNRGKIFSREEILHDVWPDGVIVLDRVVDVNITRLRTKLGKYGRLIITRPGYGYGFSI